MDFTSGPARKLLAAHEPGTVREQLDLADLVRLDNPAAGTVGSGAVIIDNNRLRPFYFDGRFLAARDLIRDQNYFLARQADLGRAGGSGIVYGLLVTPGGAPTKIRIAAGHGLTPAGELVLLESNVEIDLASIADIQRLDAAFGLRQIPNPPAGNRSGLFVVALRPVEFTANPIASYPTSINGPRSQEDGDIIEAVAITLVPYPKDGASGEINQRRRRVAREIFLTGGVAGLPAEALPLAMIALERNNVQWIDPYLVRREVGAEHGDILSLGFAPRATREAYLLQYDNNLQDVMNERRSLQRGPKFTAGEHFDALPPAGRMPTAAINSSDFTQVFFPPEVDVELSFVPDDEVRALLEESLLLPPIDLTLTGDDLESTSVVVLLPVPRHQVRELKSRLTALSRPLPAAAPNLIAKRRPLEMLRTLRFPLATLVDPAVVADPSEQAWQQALAATDLVWFMRRRNLSYKSDVAGLPVEVLRNELKSDGTLETRLRGLGALTRFRDLRAAASSNAVGLISRLLNSPKLLASDVLTESALAKLESAPNLDSANVLTVATPFMNPGFGVGITRAESVNPALKDRATIKALLDSGALSIVDKLGSTVQSTERLKLITSEVVSLTTSNDPQKAARLKAVASATALLASRKALTSSPVAEAALTSLETAANRDAADAAAVAKTFDNPAFGGGLARVVAADEGVNDTQVLKDISASGVLPDLDRLGRVVTDEAQLKTITKGLLDLARGSDPQKAAKIRDLVNTHLKDTPQ